MGPRANLRWAGIALLIAIGVPRCAIAATALQVRDAIQKARDYLYKQQNQGDWEGPKVTRPNQADAPTRPDAGQYGGYTALVTYALLAAGERPTNPSMAQAIKFLSAADMNGTYAVALRAQVWPFLAPSPRVTRLMQQDARILQTGMRMRGEARGMYRYLAGDDGAYDHSSSQFALLGMWALSESNAIEIPDSYWSAADAAWRHQQLKDGSWCYINDSPDKENAKSYPAMTAAGVATLFITSDTLNATRDVGCHGNTPDPNIETGLAWLGDHFASVLEPGISGQATQYCALYGVERIGLASGRKYLGEHDWYTEGADWLISGQHADGSWGEPGDLWKSNDRNIVQTSFALLFLSRGRSPVIMNKLQYNIIQQGKTIEGPWNQRPRDLAHLGRWMGRQAEREFNWQTVSLSAPVDELHDAPILYLAGNAKLDFNADEKRKLRQFVEEGGLILGNADCANADFSASFKSLGSELFTYPFRDLPAAHAIYTNQPWAGSKWKTNPDLQGLSNGVRELMLLIPQSDISRNWQSNAYLGHEEPYQLADDIVRYATDQQWALKGETVQVHADEKIKAAHSIKVARVQYDGNWDPEPGGWRRLAAIIHNQHGLDAIVEPVRLGEGKLKGHALIHLTGTAAFKFSDTELADLKARLDHGATLVIDAAGGSGEFATSAEMMLAALYPESAAQLKTPLSPDDAVYSAATGKPTAVAYRRWMKKNLPERMSDPRLRGIEHNHRVVVFYSPEDLSAGLVGEPVDGIAGYEPDSATELMTDIILHALHLDVRK